MGRLLTRELKATEYTVIVAIILAAAFRVALPYVLKAQINRRLNAIPGYTGHVGDVGVKLWHSGYEMRHFVIQRRGEETGEPFIAADDISFTVAYRDLFHGRFTSDVKIVRGRLNFRRSPDAAANQNLSAATMAPPSPAPQPAPKPSGPPEPAKPWQVVVRDLFPVKITHLELVDSSLRYTQEVAQPPINLVVEHLNLTANGLRNRPDKHDGPLPATITANGQTNAGGDFHMVVKADPLAEEPHFQITMALEHVSLPALNPFLLDHADVDVSRGTLQVYSEITAADGNYSGYVKPILTDLNFQRVDDVNKSLPEQVWKDIVAQVSKLLRDRQHKQVATIIPFAGSFTAIRGVEIGATLRYLFRNGFIEALSRGLEKNPAAVGIKPAS